MNYPSPLLRDLRVIFNTDKAKAPKPRLKRVHGEWWCVGDNIVRISDSPTVAFWRWLVTWIMNNASVRLL